MTDQKGPADNLLLAEWMRKEFELKLNELLGYECNVEIHVHSFQERNTHSIAHDACLIRHEVWRSDGHVGIRIGEEKKFHIYINPRTVRQ